MKAMGFKDRGHTKFCFKSYESAEDDYASDLNEMNFIEGEEIQIDED